MLVPRMLVSVTVGLPVISAFSAVESQAIGCGQPWQFDLTWDCSPQNDADYKLVVLNYDTLAQIGPDFSTVNQPGYTDDTGETGDSGQTGFPHTRRYILQVIRLSDSAVMQALNSARTDVETGPVC